MDKIYIYIYLLNSMISFALIIINSKILEHLENHSPLGLIRRLRRKLNH